MLHGLVYKWTEFMTDIVYKQESYQIQGAIFEVYREMGSGFLEAVYQECLEIGTKSSKMDSGHPNVFARSVLCKPYLVLK